MTYLINLLVKSMLGWAITAAYNLEAISASTHARIEKKFQDNLIGANPAFLKFAEKEGKVLIDGGKELTFPVIVDDGNATSYYGDDVLPVSRPGGLQALTFQWKQFASTIVIDGIEEVMNSGPEAQADVLEGRMKQGESTTANKFEAMLNGDGTGNGGKDWNGFQNIISDTPTTGTIGGLSRATYAQLQNQIFSTAVSAFNTSQAGRNAMTRLYVDCTKGDRSPNWGETTKAIWVLYQLSLTANEKFEMMNGDKKLASAGFKNIVFMGDCPITYSDNCPTAHMYLMRIAKPKTTGGIFLMFNRDRHFKLGKFIEPADQDKRIAKVLSAGQLCTDAPYLNGVITNITG